MPKFLKIFVKRSINAFLLICPASLIKYIQDKTIYAPRIKAIRIDEKGYPLFNTIFFEVRTRCNGSCMFCAASIQSEKRKDTSLDIELYRKIINDLREMKYSGRIAYHVNNDPLLFRDLYEFIKIAREYLPESLIHICTNGKALSHKKALLLYETGVDRITVNYYTNDVSKEVPDIFTDIANDVANKRGAEFTITRRKVDEVLESRAGTAPNKNDKSTWPRGYCQRPFDQFNVTVDGRVSKCCADFFFSDVMGNAKDQSLKEIWLGDKFNEVRENLLKGNRELVDGCKDCDYYGVKKIKSRLGNLIYELTR